MALRPLVFATLFISAFGLVACSKHETANDYDPRVDGAQPLVQVALDPSILDDPKNIVPVRAAPAPRPTGTATSGPKPETGPAPEGSSEPIAPPLEGPAIPPPPDVQ